MKYKPITRDVLDTIKKELLTNKKKVAIDWIISLQGGMGLVFQALEEMYYHGKFMYPLTYEYRRELTKYYSDYIKEQSKNWRR